MEPANSNVPRVPVISRADRLERDIRYQLSLAPFGLTVGDLQRHLREDCMGDVGMVSLFLAVDRLVSAGGAEMQRRGERDFVCSVAPVGARAAPRPLGRAAGASTTVDTTWDGLVASTQAYDRSLDAAEALLLWPCVGLGVLGMLVGGALMAGWL